MMPLFRACRAPVRRSKPTSERSMDAKSVQFASILSGRALKAGWPCLGGWDGRDGLSGLACLDCFDCLGDWGGGGSEVSDFASAEVETVADGKWGNLDILAEEAAQPCTQDAGAARGGFGRESAPNKKVHSSETGIETVWHSDAETGDCAMDSSSAMDSSCAMDSRFALEFDQSCRASWYGRDVYCRLSTASRHSLFVARRARKCLRSRSRLYC